MKGREGGQASSNSRRMEAWEGEGEWEGGAMHRRTAAGMEAVHGMKAGPAVGAGEREWGMGGEGEAQDTFGDGIEKEGMSSFGAAAGWSVAMLRRTVSRQASVWGEGEREKERTRASSNCSCLLDS